MADSFVMVARNIKSGQFGNEPGGTKWLQVPSGKAISPDQSMTKSDWIEAVCEDACFAHDADADERIGDILFFVHGYNNDQDIVIKRHRLLLKDLKKAGYQGTLVSFDWPSASSALNYLEDRSDAKATAFQLVKDGLAPLAKLQRPACQINVHVLAHSMGAFVIREALDDADDRRSIAANSWTISQTVLIGGDLSSSSMKRNDSKSSSLFRRSIRLTNYFSRYDSALKLSNVKRIGVAPRVGRIGLPEEIPSKAVDVDCSDYWNSLAEKSAKFHGQFDHSWYVGDPLFTRDLLLTINGDLDRHAFPTRLRTGPSRFQLIGPS